MRMKRREFLGTAAAGAAGALGAGRLAHAAAADIEPSGIVPLGEGLKVTRIGIGTGMRGWLRESNQTRLGEEGFRNLLHYCYDRSIRLIDMADLYGTHGHVARAFRDKPRDNYTLVTKIWFRPNGLAEEERPDAGVLVERFLKELKTDYIDICQLHCVTSADWPTELRKQMDRLADMKQKGAIRAHGVSCHSVEALEAAAEEPWVDVVHARVNPFGFRTDGPMEEVVPVLKKLHAAGKGIIGMKLIGEGTFDEEKRREALKFAMGLGVVDAMIVGFEKPEEVDAFEAGVARNLKAAAG